MGTNHMVDIAFIGLGAMGSGMAANLAKAGHRVFAYDLAPAALEAAVAAGCEASPSVAEAVAQADFVVTMLPTGAHVLDVYQGPDGVFAHVRPNAALIDCSTISVDDARALGEAARAKGFMMCDAPVSGGVAAASAGTLTFMPSFFDIDSAISVIVARRKNTMSINGMISILATFFGFLANFMEAVRQQLLQWKPFHAFPS